MSERPSEPGPTRAEIWDARHTAPGPIESGDADPTLVEEVATMTPGIALDLGAGDGRNAIWLAGRGWRVNAVDFSAVAVDRGQALAIAAGVEIDWRARNLPRRVELLAASPPHAPPGVMRLISWQSLRVCGTTGACSNARASHFDATW